MDAGNRISLGYTRSIIDAIHNGSLLSASTETLPIFHLSIPTQCAGVPDEILNPSTFWKDEKIYWENAKKLAQLFQDNFKQFVHEDPLNINQYGPNLEDTFLPN